MLSSTRLSVLVLLDSVSAGLGKSIRAATTLDEAPSSRGALASLGCLPRSTDHWRLDRGSLLKLLSSPSELFHLVKTASDVSHQI